MSNVFDLQGRQIIHLPPSGGGGTYDGMEARVAKLEAAAEHLQVQLGDVKVSVEHSRSLLEQMIDRLARIETDLKHLPTKTTLTWGAVAFFVAMAGAVAGIVALNNS